MTRLSWVMTAGTGWLLFLLLATLVDRQRDWKATQAVVPALWLATATLSIRSKSGSAAAGLLSP
jgi:hypothetical protein